MRLVLFGSFSNTNLFLQPIICFFENTNKCKDCCTTKAFGGFDLQGPSCSIKGNNGGNGGNGGNSGKPGETGKVLFMTANGHTPEFKHVLGNHGIPGEPGKGKTGGKQGLGGCGEHAKCNRVGNGHGFKTNCVSSVQCSGSFTPEGSTANISYKGAACKPNKDGINGVRGGIPNLSPNYDKNSITIANDHIVDASPVFLDYLLKYAIILTNEETMNEAQEILIFLQRYHGGIGRSASQLLDRMGKNGDFYSHTKRIPRQMYPELSNKTEKLIQRGVRLENALNVLGELFEFKFFVYEILDLMLEESEAYMNDLQADEEQLLKDLSNSFQALQEKWSKFSYRRLLFLFSFLQKR